MCKFRQRSSALELFYTGIDCVSQSGWEQKRASAGTQFLYVHQSDRDVNLLMASPVDATGATPKNKEGSKRGFMLPKQVSGRTY